MRPWIEPAQSYEKNQLGLGQVFLNGLRFTWARALLADAAVLLRARVLLGRPTPQPLLTGWMPRQLPLGLQVEGCEGFSPEIKLESAKSPIKSRFQGFAFATPSVMVG